MQVLCDVHISYKLVNFLLSKGIATLHVNQILDKLFTKDSDIALFADTNAYVLISKDADFKQSHLLKNTPKKLIKINLGNISNQVLIEIFEKNLAYFLQIAQKDTFLIEINKEHIFLISG